MDIWAASICHITWKTLCNFELPNLARSDHSTWCHEYLFYRGSRRHAMWSFLACCWGLCDRERMLSAEYTDAGWGGAFPVQSHNNLPPERNSLTQASWNHAPGLAPNSIQGQFRGSVLSTTTSTCCKEADGETDRGVTPLSRFSEFFLRCS